MNIILPSIHVHSPAFESTISMQNKGSMVPYKMVVKMGQLAGMKENRNTRMQVANKPKFLKIESTIIPLHLISTSLGI